MNKEKLYNTKDRKILKQELLMEPFKRVTCSFYRYIEINDVQLMRDTLYKESPREKREKFISYELVYSGFKNGFPER